jgi:hypothetical protein
MKIIAVIGIAIVVVLLYIQHAIRFSRRRRLPPYRR